MGNPNIHVAFQNMSISHHAGGVPMGHQVHVATPNQHNVHAMNGNISPAGPGQAVHYMHMTEMYVPCYTNSNHKPPSPTCLNGSHVINAPPQVTCFSVSTSFKSFYKQFLCE